jgi:hypothetical protein
MSEPTFSLLTEYKLTERTYGILVRCRSGPIWWRELKRDSGAPPSARLLARRGLLDGPVSNENIDSRPFNLSQAGRELLDRIERGLHAPAWLSPGRGSVLVILAAGYRTETELVAAGLARASIYSLARAGYIRPNGDDDTTWHITALGLEALNEWRETERWP